MDDSKLAASTSAEDVIAQLGKILRSARFAGAGQSRALLKFVVEQTVAGGADRLKEYTIGAEALGRGASFDPRTDTVVRAEASRLRLRLERYYAEEGKGDRLEIALPKGSYVATFTERAQPHADAQVLDPMTGAPGSAPGPVFARVKWLVGGALIGAFAVALVASVGWPTDRPSAPGGAALAVAQFTIAPPPGMIFEAPIARQSFAISPDGTRLAFTATDASGSKVWLRELGALDLKPITGTEGARTVFWSPDGRSLFYAVKRQFKQANLDTGSSRTVAKLPFSAMYGFWRSKSELLLALGPRTNYALALDSGGLRPLPDASMRWAQFLPGSDTFIHVSFDPALGRYRAYATDYTSRKSIALMETDSRVQYAPPLRPGRAGHLLFIRGGSLLAQAFDADQLRLNGEPFPLVQNVSYFSPSASGNFSVSENGVLVYQTSYPASELLWFDRAGNKVAAVGKPAPFNGTVRLSTDGRRLLAGLWSPENGGVDVWTFQMDGSDARRLTFPPAVHPRSVWSPDGSRVAFASTKTGVPHLAMFELAGQVSEVPLMNEATAKQVAATQIQLPTDWSRDGRFIAYDISLGEEEREVWVADVANGSVVPLLRSEASQWGGVFSPDGKSVAFVSDESGRPEVYVQALDGSSVPRLLGEKRRVSNEGAWVVRWRPDGQELFFLGLDNWLHAVPMTTALLPGGEPKPLFRIPGTPQYGAVSDFQFDVTRDGQRFIMTTTGSAQPPPFTVVKNWQEKFHAR